MFTKKLLAIFVGTLLLSTACAHLALNPRSPDAVRKRVQEAWEAKRKGNWGVVYDMTTSSYKSKVPKAAFMSSPKINTISYIIQDIKIVEPGKRALVTVKAKLDMMGRQLPMVIREQWVWENGQWRLMLSPTPFKSLFMHKPIKPIKKRK